MKINTIDKIKQTKVEVYKGYISNRDNKYKMRKIFDTTLYSFLTYNQKKAKDDVIKLREINKRDEKEAKEYKKLNLVACTISATFNERRVVGDVKEKSGLIAIDIDKDKNPFIDVEKAKRDVMSLPYVMLSELSCRGNGIWALIAYDSNNYIGDVFNALKEDFKSIGYNIDKGCGDITRLRFVSYDDNMLIRPEAEVYEKTKKREERDYDIKNDWIMTKQDIKDLVVIIYVLVNYHNYHKDDYDEWLLDGFRLATVPNKEVGLRLFQMISERSDNYKGSADVENKFDECRQTTTYSTNILGFYFNKIKEIYGDSWRYRVNDLLKQKNIKI